MKKTVIIVMSLLLMISITQAQEETKEEAFGRNNISIMLSDVVLKRISFEYEHILGDKGNMSINIPVSVSIGEAEDVYGDEVDWWGGLGMKLYPTGQGTIRYYFGPEVRVISAKYRDTFVIYYDGWAENVNENENYIHTAFLLNNGMIYQPVENFIFTVNLGLGFVARDQKTNDGIMPMATPSVRMGFKF